MNALYLFPFLAFQYILNPFPDAAPCSDWKLNAVKGSTKVYVRQCDDSPIKEFKATDQFYGNFDAVAQLMKAVETTQKVSSRCVEAKVLQRLDGATSIQYFLFSMPFGVSNREVIVKNIVRCSATQISSVSEEVDLPDLPVKKDVVRIKRSTASYLFTRLPNGLIEMEYIGRVDPNGEFPSWIINLLAKKEAIKIIDKLKSLAQN